MLSNTEIVKQHVCGTKIERDFYHVIMRGDDYANDLWPEVIQAVMETDNAKLNELVSNGELTFFVIRIIHNLGKSSTSPFYKKYKSYKRDKLNVDIHDFFGSDESRFEQTLELDPYNKQEHVWDERYASQVCRIYEKIKDDLHWYDRQLFDLYVEKYNQRGPVRRISEETMIPEQTVAASIRNTKDILKKRVKHELQKQYK